MGGVIVRVEVSEGGVIVWGRSDCGFIVRGRGDGVVIVMGRGECGYSAGVEVGLY